MKRSARRLALGLLILSGPFPGCTLLPEDPAGAIGAKPAAVVAAVTPAAVVPESTVPAFPRANVLSVEDLVQEVPARNPTLPQMTAAGGSLSALAADDSDRQTIPQSPH